MILLMLRMSEVGWAGYAVFGLMALCLLLMGCNKRASEETPRAVPEGGKMVTLTVDFQEGFADDTVVVRVNDEEVLWKEGVRTKLLLGLAYSFVTEVEKGAATVRISVVTQNIVETIPLEIAADTHLGMSVENGRIEYMKRDVPFNYA